MRRLPQSVLHQDCVRAPFGRRSGVPFQRRLTVEFALNAASKVLVGRWEALAVIPAASLLLPELLFRFVEALCWNAGLSNSVESPESLPGQSGRHSSCQRGTADKLSSMPAKSSDPIGRHGGHRRRTAIPSLW